MIKFTNNQEYNEIVLCYVTFFEFRIMFIYIVDGL